MIYIIVFVLGMVEVMNDNQAALVKKVGLTIYRGFYRSGNRFNLSRNSGFTSFTYSRTL